MSSEERESDDVTNIRDSLRERNQMFSHGSVKKEGEEES